MAKLSAHGQHKQVTFLKFKKAYCSDGTILKNYGYGWKLFAKLKNGITWEDAASRAIAYQERMKRERPLFAAYKALALKLCPSLEKRQYLITGLELLSNDPDGLYTELSENYATQNYFDFDDINSMCRAFDACQREHKALGPLISTV